MSAWRQLTHGTRNLLRRRARDGEIADEVQHYFEAAIEAYVAEGLTGEEAAQRARLDAGRPSDAEERARTYGWEQLVPRLLADLHFAARQLLRHRTFTAAAVATLALGIGANTAVFTVIERVLLTPLPYAHADRICVLDTHWTDTDRTSPRVTGPDVLDVQKLSHSLAAVSLYSGGKLGVTLGGRSVYTSVTLADADFARVFSLRPVAGQMFRADQAEHAAVVSEQFARDNFGSAKAALHKVLHIEDRAIEITGVLPGSFHFPEHSQIWAAAPRISQAESRTAFNYKAVALLKPGTSQAAAQAELSTLSLRLERAYPDANRGKQMQLVSLQKALAAEARPTLLLLWVAVGLMLLIACVNVAHLQLMRAVERRREIAVRKALGASRWQILLPILLESLLLSAIGAAGGLLLAWPSVRVLVAMAPAELPHGDSIHIDGWVLVFSLGLAGLAALGSSLFPALRAAGIDPAEAMKRDTSRGIGAHGAAHLRESMVLAEIAITFMLAVGAGLLLHSLFVLNARDLGYNTRSLLIADVDVPAQTSDQYRRAIQQLSSIFATARATPGVRDAAGIMGLPTGDYGSNGYYQTRGGLPPNPLHPVQASFSVISPRYFATMQIPLRRGRDFTDGDTAGSGPVAVISASLARQSFGAVNPIGRHMQCGLDSAAWMTIVGVVGDVRQASAADAPGPTLYMPMTQHPFYANQINIVLRTAVAPLSLLPAVQREIIAASPLAAIHFTTMDAMVDQSLAAQHFRAVLVSTFAAIGLVLALLGVYGTTACSVAQRTFEIGLRMALGADRGVIVQQVLGRALRLACAGIGVGLVLSLLLGSLVRSMLTGITEADPTSLLAAALLIVAAAAAAAWLPARRATRISPSIALRAE